MAPFEASFTGGVYVSAGDVNGDGKPDLAITPDEGGGPRVDVYRGAGFGKIVSFFGIDDPNFRGGARSNIADMNGDGTADLVVVAGFGGGPRVAAFDGASLGGTPVKLFGDFFAFGGEDAARLRNGVAVAAADLNADGRDDLIFGGGKGGSPRVFAADGGQLFASGETAFGPLANFFVANDGQSRGDVQLVARDLDGDGRPDLAANVTGLPIRVYDGGKVALAPGQEPPLLAQLNVFTDAPEIGAAFVG